MLEGFITDAGKLPSGSLLLLLLEDSVSRLSTSISFFSSLMISSQSFSSYLPNRDEENDVKTLETSIEFVKSLLNLKFDTCLSQSSRMLAQIDVLMACRNFISRGEGTSKASLSSVNAPTLPKISRMFWFHHHIKQGRNAVQTAKTISQRTHELNVANFNIRVGITIHTKWLTEDIANTNALGHFLKTQCHGIFEVKVRK